MKDADFSLGQIEYARQITHEYNSKYIDSSHAPKGTQVNLGLENLNHLDEPIPDTKLDELLQDTDDKIPEVAKHDLSFDQLQKLSPAEKQEYRDTREKLFSELKTKIHHGISNFEQKMDIVGLQKTEDKDKKFAAIPEKSLWGDGDTYYLLRALQDRYQTISDYLGDVGRQVYRNFH